MIDIFFYLFLICIDFTGKYKIRRLINAFGVRLVIFKNLVYVRLVRQAALLYKYEGHPISSDNDPIKQNPFL